MVRPSTWTSAVLVAAGLAGACTVFGNLDELAGDPDAGSGGGSGDASVGGGGGDAGESGAGGTTDSGVGGGTSCSPGKKACGADCVPKDDPATGCAATDCSPCAPAHASAICVGGECTVAQCANGYEDCNGDPKDGCEVSLKTDAANCGACAKSCALPNAQVACSQGQCQFTGCDGGFADCNKSGADGCEVNTASDPSNCGTCAKACTAPSGKSATCDNGACGVSNCTAPLADCDKDSAGSCETNLSSSASACGFCGNACGFANGKAACQSGKCVLTGCNTGYGECDNNAANGCETPTSASITNCGACGKTCTGGANAVAICSGGACGLKCNAGFEDCDKNPANGCEVNLLTSTTHCGACGAACNATNGTPACGGGGCGISCSAGFGNCNASASDGCETTLTSNAHCGACGKSIGAAGDTNFGPSWSNYTIRRIQGTGGALKIRSCYTDEYEQCSDPTLTLSGFSAAGDTNFGPSWSNYTVRRIQGVNNTLKISSCYSDEYEQCKDVILTLTGVTASGDTNHGPSWNSHSIRRIQGAGGTLKVRSCYTDEYEQCADRVITFTCKP
jgi:hypothetical protein